MTTGMPKCPVGGWWADMARRCTSMKYNYLLIIISMLTALYLYLNWICVTVPSAVNIYPKWSRVSLPARANKAKYFTSARDADVYMYSAFVHLPGEIVQKPDLNVTDIIITTLGKSRAKMSCCVLSRDRRTLHVTAANTYFEHIETDAQTPVYMARQFICRVPTFEESLRGSVITLSSTNCSTDTTDYLPILHPARVPGGLALCAKVAHSGGLDPEKVIEWFEVQRLLGVDRVLIFDLGNPENLTRVFKYYQNLGILDLQPYELPGLPENRSLQESWKDTAQFNHDETMAVLECRQRMAGYDYIISHDVDEFIIPRQDVNLKDFLKEKLHKEPTAAGFFFYTEFFITTWEPTNPEEDLMVKRYRKSTVPRWECYKYVYLPSRVKTSVTHNFYPSSSQFTGPTLPPDDAILHHYRQCPKDTWGTCSVETNIDDTMTRYRDLEARVARVRTATSTKPQWSRSERGAASERMCSGVLPTIMQLILPLLVSWFPM